MESKGTYCEVDKSRIIFFYYNDESFSNQYIVYYTNHFRRGFTLRLFK